MKMVLTIAAIVALTSACQQPAQVVETEGQSAGISKSGNVVAAEGKATGRAKEAR